MTCMPRKLKESTDHNFQFTEIREVSNWFKWVAGKGAFSVAEADCNQFDSINPKQVVVCVQHRRRLGCTISTAGELPR